MPVPHGNYRKSRVFSIDGQTSVKTSTKVRTNPQTTTRQFEVVSLESRQHRHSSCWWSTLHTMAPATSKVMTNREHQHPEYLFRAYSDQSQGFNSFKLFAPKAAVDRSKVQLLEYQPALARFDHIQELKDSLAWRKKASHFTCFTQSLLFAIAMASYRKYKNSEQNIKIVCFRTDGARTPSGDRVHFEWVHGALEASGIELRTNRGDVKEYRDVYTTLDCVVPGKETWVASFDQLLDQGLYQLYSGLSSNASRYYPKLHKIAKFQRDDGFRSECTLSQGAITIAAKIASSFQPIDRQLKPAKYINHLMAQILAFRKVAPKCTGLREWLSYNSKTIVDLDEEASDVAGSQGLPEMEQYHILVKIFGASRIHDVLTNDSGMHQTRIASEQASRSVWRPYMIEEEVDEAFKNDRSRWRNGGKDARRSRPGNRILPHAFGRRDEDRTRIRKSRDRTPRSDREPRVRLRRDFHGRRPRHPRA